MIVRINEGHHRGFMCEMEGADDADDGVGVTSGERREKCVRFVIVRTLPFSFVFTKEKGK